MEAVYDSIPDILEDVRRGRLVIIVDDKDRENEGDLMAAAEKATPEALSFMMSEGRGLVCLSLSAERCERLRLPMQVSDNRTLFGTNFTVSIDHRSLGADGVTAEGRAKTIARAVADDASAGEFQMPGFVFPLRAVDGGVLRRRGQTEGSVDLARLAGLKSAAVICELLKSDGEQLRGPALFQFCRTHGLRCTSIEEIKEYRLRNEVMPRRTGERILTGVRAGTRSLTLRLLTYIDDVDGQEHLAFVFGNPKQGCLVRIHSECLTGDVFGSRRCDCGFQFQLALKRIAEEGSGVIVYLHQEGRGIGLGNKLQAYELQDRGVDTVEANLRLGFPADARSYRVGARILHDLGLQAVRLMTNNPAKATALEEHGVSVMERVPSIAPADKFNERYLKTKREKFGHLL